MNTRLLFNWRLWLLIVVLPFMLAAEAIHQEQLIDRQKGSAGSETSLPLRKSASQAASLHQRFASANHSINEQLSPAAGSSQPMDDSSLEAELSPNSLEAFDYVIIVPDITFVASMNPLKVWKEQIGFHVKIVTLTDIISLYPSGVDDAERIWKFLHDRYFPINWGIRYVLLVGDIDRIPMRFLFPDGGWLEGNGYGSDYYYANLDVDDWDLDNDLRWGEFTHDQLDLHAEVLVGRLPFNNPTTLNTISNQIVAYEQSIASWKRQGLLVHGVYDYVTKTSKTDTANLAEHLRSDFFNYYGWTTTRLYEGEGISPSTYISDTRISQANYDSFLSGNNYGVINITMHGASDHMESKVWLIDADNDNFWDTEPPTTEAGLTSVSRQANIAANPTNAVVFLNGCETARVLNLPVPSFYSPLQSLFLYNLTDPNLMVKEYLENGSPAVIGSTAGSDYHRLWSQPDQWGSQTLNYLFYNQLIEKDRPVGDAFFAAMEEYTDYHPPLRGIRDFNYFGDPSLLQQGIEVRPGGTDTLVTEGEYKFLAADYDSNGDMYVGVAVDNPSGTSTSINIHRSTDHGQTWIPWTWVDTPAPTGLVRNLSLLVGRLTSGTPYLHVFYAMDGGRVYDTRLDLGDPDNRSTIQIDDLEKLPRFLTVARTPGSGLSSIYIYTAWEYAYISDSQPAVVLFRSGDNGASWVRMDNWDDLEQPSIDAGPTGAVHMAAVQNDDAKSVVALRSTDYGVNWSEKIFLTNRDGAERHVSPDVAVSTDPAYPVVWVAYEYDFLDPVWGSSRDLRFAYSDNNGVNWQMNRSLASDMGRDEWIPDLASYHAAANPWINLAYNQDLSTATGNERLVIWRYTSGGRPNAWNPRRIVNDFPGAAPNAVGPIVVYSPGSPVSGSGVVYGGENKQNVYFSAPWLSPLNLQPAASADSLSAPNHQDNSDTPLSEAPAVVTVPDPEDDLPLFWMPATHIPDASSIGGLAIGSDGALYASAVLDTTGSGGGGHMARVYRSTNLGDSWTPTTDFDNSWSVSSLIRTQENTLLASGMALSGYPGSLPADPDLPDAPTPLGVIYRTTNNGLSWNTVYSAANMAVYRLEQASNGTLYAGTGWSGKLLKSTDDGLTWQQLADFGAGTTVRDILRTSQGRLVVALEKPAGGEIRSTSNPSSGWTKASGLSGVLSVNDLLEVNGKLYAATRHTSNGQIYQSDLAGLSWSNPDTISPSVTSITRLILGAHGQILAGAENSNGSSNTTVFRNNAGQHSWTPYNGWMDMATSVYDLLSTDQGLYAATGYIYGNLFRVRPDNLYWRYLPLVRR